MLLLLIDRFFAIYMIMLFVRILGSWVPDIQQFRAFQFVAWCVDPYLNLFRQIIPPLGMIDISPMIAFFALGFIEKFLKLFIINLM